MPLPDQILDRLEDQISWYERKRDLNRRAFRWIKATEIVAAAIIPLLAVLNLNHATWLAGGLGIVITILEGLLHLNHYQENWITYRSTCDSLKHEKYTYLGKASPYANVSDPHALLAERIELLVSQEHAKWASSLARDYSERPRIQGTEAPERASKAEEREKKTKLGTAKPEREPSEPKPEPQPDIRVHVVTQAGDSHPIDTPSDLTVEEFIAEVVAGLDLPSVDAEGRPVNWTIDDKDTGKTLDSQTTLHEANVGSGHQLYLRRQGRHATGDAHLVVAGGGSPVTPPTRGHIKVRVFTPSGEAHSIETPSELTVGDLIDRLLRSLNLPRVDSEELETYWIMDDWGTGKTLDREKSLFENRVGEGHHLYLHLQTLAGGKPITLTPSPVEFSVGYPRSIAPQTWYPLLTYVHGPEATSAVQNHSKLILGRERAKSYLSVGQRPTKSVERGAQITVVPEFPGCRVNPPHGTLFWLEDWHCVEFRFRLESDVEPNTQGQALNGRVTFYVGPILVSEITVSPTLESEQFQSRRAANHGDVRGLSSGLRFLLP